MTNNPDRVLQEVRGSTPGLQLSAPHHNRVLPVPALPLVLPPQNAATEAVPASSSQSSGLASLFQYVLIMFYHPFSSVMRDIWSAPIAGQS